MHKHVEHDRVANDCGKMKEKERGGERSERV